jgi:hypothetical protein
MSQIILFDMPEDPALRPAWLERKLRSPQCGLLLDELAAMRAVAIAQNNTSAEIADQSLDDFLGPLKEQVLSKGLKILSAEKFAALMRSPELITDLVIEIELSGGEYWRRLSGDSDDTSVIKQKVVPLPTGTSVPPGAADRGRYWLGTIAALAAAILLAIFLWPVRQTKQLAWERPGVFDVSLGGPAYLNHLADAADDWFRQDPHDSQELEGRIRGFRRGCDLLLAASHPQLSDADRAWLRERCQVWSEKLDQQLADLAKGEDWSKVRNAADETIQKLIDALRKRAAGTV